MLMTLEEFQKERAEIISEMLDHPDKHGNCQTGKAYAKLDKLFCKIGGLFLQYNDKIFAELEVVKLSMKEMFIQHNNRIIPELEVIKSNIKSSMKEMFNE